MLRELQAAAVRSQRESTISEKQPSTGHSAQIQTQDTDTRLWKWLQAVVEAPVHACVTLVSSCSAKTQATYEQWPG